jgi:hypothetical protein
MYVHEHFFVLSHFRFTNHSDGLFSKHPIHSPRNLSNYMISQEDPKRMSVLVVNKPQLLSVFIS